MRKLTVAVLNRNPTGRVFGCGTVDGDLEVCFPEGVNLSGLNAFVEELLFVQDACELGLLSIDDGFGQVEKRSIESLLENVVKMHNKQFERKIVVDANQEVIRVGDIGYTGENVYFIKASSRDSDNPTVFQDKGLHIVSEDIRPYISPSVIDGNGESVTAFNLDTLRDEFMSPDERVILVNTPVTLILK